MAEQDPLYLFTAHSFQDIVSNNFHESLSPFFAYLELLYGPPRGYKYGEPISEYQYNAGSRYKFPVVDGKILASNFQYEIEGQNKLPRIELLHGDLGMSGEMKPLNLCSLTVRVPAEDTHEFWRNPRYTWDSPEDEPHCTFTVAKYGTTTLEACWRATLSALEMIGCIRENVAPKGPSTPRSTSNCPALQLGGVLHHKFKNSKDMFNRPMSLGLEEFWTGIYEELSERIDVFREAHSRFQYLLEYYQVYIPV